MWMKAGVLGDTGFEFSKLPLWAWAGLGMAIAFSSTFRKARKENDNGINRLPDDILCNIVSRLGDTEASRTSILSKRWRKIWTMYPEIGILCLHTLDIPADYEYHLNAPYADRQRFFKAVNQSLKLYSGRKLKGFFVHCCFLERHTCHLVRWMESISRLDVEELYLGQSCILSYEPRYRKFTFSFKLIDGLLRLKKLHLMSCKLETSFVSQCNSLVSITLHEIELNKHELSDILLSFPNLTSLGLVYCELPKNLRISGQNLKLVTLELRSCWNVSKLDISDCNHLVTILIKLHFKVEISMSSLPKLETMYLQTFGMDYCFEDVRRDLPRLRFLSIQAELQILWLPPRFGVFGNVRILYLLTENYSNGKAFKEVDLWNFAPVLTACPFLEEFYLSVRGPFCKGERKERCDALRRHKHLQHMELSGFSNTQGELEFAKFILTSAEVLRLLLLRPAFRICDRMCYSFKGAKDLIQLGDAQVICANLQGHAISTRARVEIC